MASNPIVLTGFANPDPNAAPLNIVELVKLLNQLVQSAIQGSYTPYVLGHEVPSAEDQDKVWFALDPSGRPLGFFTFYNGAWRRTYNGMLGEIRMYSGDPTIDFDANGLGKVGAGYWYDGWHLMNGKDGVPDWSDKFIIGGTMNDLSKGWNAASGNWQSFVEGVAKATGGAATITLNASNTYIAPTPRIAVTRWKADGNTPDASSGLMGLPPDSTGGTALIQAATTGNVTPAAITNLPPYIAAGFITFVGYA